MFDFSFNVKLSFIKLFLDLNAHFYITIAKIASCAFKHYNTKIINCCHWKKIK